MKPYNMVIYESELSRDRVVEYVATG